MSNLDQYFKFKIDELVIAAKADEKSDVKYHIIARTIEEFSNGIQINYMVRAHYHSYSRSIGDSGYFLVNEQEIKREET